MKVSVSILDCDFLHLGTELKAVEAAGADCIHLDVMDGRFVDGISFGRPLGVAVRRGTGLPIHTHLMVVEPERQIDAYRPFSQSVIFHIEAAPDPTACIARIRAAGIKVGVSLNPDTGIGVLRPWLDRIDDVLVMSVFPGRGGQTFMPEALARVAELRRLVATAGNRVTVSVDGGVSPENRDALAAAGADILITGSTVFKSADYARTIVALKGNDQHRPAPEADSHV